MVNSVSPGSISFPGGGWDNFQKNNTPEVVQDFISRHEELDEKLAEHGIRHPELVLASAGATADTSDASEEGEAQAAAAEDEPAAAADDDADEKE